MSAARRMFTLGGVFVGGVFILGNALHWFITPMEHPAASQGRMVAVGIQAAAGLLTALYAYLQARRDLRMPQAG